MIYTNAFCSPIKTKKFLTEISKKMIRKLPRSIIEEYE